MSNHPDFISANDFIFLDHPIAVLDTETLSLSKTGAIFDVGFVITEVLPAYGQMWDAAGLKKAADFGLCRAFSFSPSVLEQTLNGRTIDPATVDWHEEKYKAKGLDFHAELIRRSKESMTANELMVEMSTLILTHNIKEMWMNHPQFDETYMENYFKSMSVKGIPWHYQASFDVATAKLAYRKRIQALNQTDLSKQFKDTGEIHTGLGDCCYNLAIISLSGIFTPLSAVHRIEEDM